MCAVVEILRFIDFDNTKKLLSCNSDEKEEFAKYDRKLLNEISKDFGLGDGEKYFLAYLKWREQFCTLKII